MLQVLTPTGGRPEAFALCQKWARRQTYTGQIVWIIVDDGPEPSLVERMPDNWTQLVIRRSPFWRQGENTQAANLMRGLDAVDPKYPLVCFEDDDYYAPDWLTHVTKSLEWAELVGEMRSRYYNVKTRQGRQLPNKAHASLCATAMRGRALQTFRHICTTRPKFIDLHLWKMHQSKRLFDGHRVVGIKGLPGRGGIGVGHKDSFTGEYDPDGVLLRRWIGDDARVYL